MTEAVVAGPASRVSRHWVQWGVIGLVAGIVADILFNIDVKKGDNGGTGPMIVVGVGLVVVAVVLFLFLLPRFTDAPKAALVVGILAVLALGAFWSALTMLLAAAAFGYGLQASTQVRSRVAMGLAAAAALVDIAAAIASA